MAQDMTEEVNAFENSLQRIEIRHWKMNKEEQNQYLQTEKEIWPDNPLGMERLLEFKGKPNWTAITAFDGKDIVGGIMAWEDLEEPVGVIEDLFVKETYRKLGLGRNLLTSGLTYLQSVGFKEMSEEKRFNIEL
ncbi:hypothetical protein CWO92_12970 [Heyndrickxia camelliae]|uniref:N-acetyltransferase domain-containing protein n=2 Tax=Heyndrickxia camelliae TaxID=1707093 RepID=A0A2N3LJ14_9BACI|nr:hypothetical protein CWO92_12970 [Heyndrickxia camelliae]